MVIDLIGASVVWDGLTPVGEPRGNLAGVVRIGSLFRTIAIDIDVELTQVAEMLLRFLREVAVFSRVPHCALGIRIDWRASAKRVLFVAGLPNRF